MASRTDSARKTPLNWLDRAIGWVSPLQGARRLVYRDMYAKDMQQRAYEGANRSDGWKPKRAGASANTDHAMDARELRIRARALVQNVPYIAQAFRYLTANVIGTGIVPRWLGPNADVMNALWKKSAGEMDADGKLSINALIALAYRTAEQDGEVLIRIRWRRSTDALNVPIQFQVLEIDWLDSSRTERRGGNAVVNGIESDALGRVVAYWLFEQHPGDVTTVLATRASRESRRVPAELIIHFYNQERPGQGRGFSRLAPVIAAVRDLATYEDSEIQRKNLESRLSVLASGDPTLVERLATSPGPSGSSAAQQAGELGPLAGGGVTHVGDGMNLTVVEPKAAPGFVEYVKQRWQIIAVGIGVTYEGMTGDVSEANFSSSRVRMIDFRREAEMTQWLSVIPRLIEPMCRAFEQAVYLTGKVRATGGEIDYSPPKWSYVDPAKDVKADQEEVSSGLSSLSEKIRARGYDPDTVFEEIRQDVIKLKRTGLMEVMPFFKANGSGRPIAPEAE